MASFMKKLVILGLMSAGLVACGGGGGSGAGSSGNSSPPPPVVDVGQITTPASNLLTVKGEQFEKQVAITQDLYDISVHATANEPIDSVTFTHKPNQYDWSGGINLEDKQARLYYLALDNKGVDRLACYSGLECFKNSSYQLLPNDQGLLLNINFNQASNELRQGKSLNRKSVNVSGNLAFNIPAHWPVANFQRFPVFSASGELIWDGQSFAVYKVDTKHAVSVNQTTYDYTLYLKGQSRKITVGVYIDRTERLIEVSVKDEGKDYIFSNLDDESDYTTYWSEDDQNLTLKFKKIKLDGYQNNKVLVLNGYLEVPKARFDITVDGESIANRHPATEEVGVYNTTKYYTISLDNDDVDEDGNNGRSTNALTLYKELNGHVWLNYFDENGGYMCGSKTQGCTGLSLANDQKTWRFNNVNIGGARVNGTYYFPGVEK